MCLLAPESLKHSKIDSRLVDVLNYYSSCIEMSNLFKKRQRSSSGGDLICLAFLLVNVVIG